MTAASVVFVAMPILLSKDPYSIIFEFKKRENAKI